MLEKRSTRIILILVILFLSVCVYLLYLTVNFPKYYPDQTLTLSETTRNFLERITLPIKIARLSWQAPDTEILVPVYGVKVSGIADSWGAPRPEDRTHEGQDIFSPKGTPVFSGTYGYVTRIAATDIGGNIVNIVGAGGRRYYYAHLDRFAKGLRVGQEVTTDTILGFVGNTGNAEDTPYHLHLGVYVLRHAIDPLPLLTNRR
ncbi:MAG: M23 family metallopeptidase [Patescibacteria group bacterium]